MIGELLKVLPPKRSRNGNVFIRITFLVDGEWAKTDVCPDFRNYRRWIPVIEAKPGTMIKGLLYKDKNKAEINADSFPEITTKYKITKEKEDKEEKEHLRSVRMAEIKQRSIFYVKSKNKKRNRS